MAKDIKQILDRFYRGYNFKERMFSDPIEFPHKYQSKNDIEISGFVSSCFAYGKVDLFKSVIEKILGFMGRSPYDFVKEFNADRDSEKFKNIRYRFNKEKDIVCLIHIISKLLKKHCSIENAFKKFFNEDDPDIETALKGFIKEITEINTTEIYGRNIKPQGLMQFFPSPKDGSACKRMNLFLRWMVRDRDIDFGIWDGIPKNKLVIPLDTHIAKISRCLGLATRKSPDWKMAVEITNSLKKLDSEDPLKYDFALCHHGISGVCKSNMQKSEECRGCIFKTD
ncbi:MAG: TIGR02757 family protein [Nitrospiraceae bacterium]|nr:TIGR02757 family protein [Nitrospiraceae bacterium]